MIVFITDFDAITKGNRSVISSLLQHDNIKLLGNDALKENLVVELRRNPNYPLFVATHGKPKYFEDNYEQPSLEDGNIYLLSERSVFIWACWTANELGRTQLGNAIYYGYTGPVGAPSAEDARLIDIQKYIFQFILEQFHCNNSESEIMQFILGLKQKVDEALYKLDDLWENSSDMLNTSDTNRFLNDVWKKLRVYYNGKEEPIRHIEGFDTDIFYED